jgi:hypothetical protein
MTGELVFIAVAAVLAGVFIWKSVRKKAKKSCCE